ncbi:hypothetical protein [Maritimibacter sp. UBA3975]|uniref:hypothetical protein n=1 Tax=Maritimibacter sp. UBA3975 TaxID=1946833 RepID=UPI000C0A2BF7|nr:hypothetical protein [Maritimibacter sp. UBA3975]MAM60853.1 hypothetical protein [Maritimibacter sp.]|tara:strand:+ start:9274 stop:9993 length:720 start_codon:yes stop_codon:yes gene_type:complete
MKIELSDLSGLPEGLQSVVETEGETSTLDLTKLMPAEDLTGLKSALQKERENVATYSKLGKPDEIQQRIADLEEKAKGTGKGAEEAQAKLDAMEQKYQGEISARDERITKMMQSNAQASLKAELAKVGFISEAIDDIAATAMARLQFNEDGTPKVLTSDGKPMIGNGPDHGATLAELAKELAEAKPYAVRDGGKGGGGKPPGSGGGTPPTGAKRSEMNHSQKAAYIRENGQSEYNKLPE